MKISHIEQVFFVADLTRCRDFYKSLFQIEPVTDVPGMVEFELAPNFKLGLMPLEGISRLLGAGLISHGKEGVPPRSELYLRVEDPHEMFSMAVSLGAKVLSPVRQRNWGDIAGYVADIEGNILVFAKQIS